jgi:hypothetical protein
MISMNESIIVSNKGAGYRTVRTPRSSWHDNNNINRPKQLHAIQPLM